MLHHAVPRIFPAGSEGFMEKHAYHAQKHQRGKEDGLYFFWLIQKPQQNNSERQ